MSGARAVDIVFVVDASGSMQPCFDGVRRNLHALLEGLTAGQQALTDVRMDVVLQRVRSGITAKGTPGPVFDFSSARATALWTSLYGSQGQGGARPGELFGSSAAEIGEALNRAVPDGDEATLVALDFALDFPWRPSPPVHRSIVVLTDEPVNGGGVPAWERATVDALCDKVAATGVRLFMAAPECPTLSELASIKGVIYETYSGTGLADVDYSKFLMSVGKTLSNATPMQGATAPRGLFGQSGWYASSAVGGAVVDPTVP